MPDPKTKPPTIQENVKPKEEHDSSNEDNRSKITQSYHSSKRNYNNLTVDQLKLKAEIIRDKLDKVKNAGKSKKNEPNQADKVVTTSAQHAPA